MDLNLDYQRITNYNHAFTISEESNFSVDDEGLSLIKTIARQRKYLKNDFVFRINDPAAELFVVKSGQLKLVKTLANGNESIFAVVGKGDFVGAAFLSKICYYQVDAIAISETEVYSLSRQQFLEIARLNPELMLSYTESLTGHLFSAWEQLSSSYSPVKLRLARALLELAQKFGYEADGWTVIETSLNHNALGAMIASTRVSVTTAMAELRNDGLVLGSRGKYKLRSLDLQMLLEDLA